MNYTSLFLDLDNTLLDFNYAEKVAIKCVLKAFNLPFSDETVKVYSNINKNYWESFERGDIPKSAIYEGRFKTLLEYLNENRDTSAISKQYINELSNGYYKIENTDEILNYLKNKGYKLYATTNGMSTTQYKRIKNSGLEPYFNKIFVSEDIGHQKPEKEYFNYILENIPEKSKSKILIIGDSQSSDILGGINSEIDTCWYNPDDNNAKYYSKYEIKSLLDLKNIL